MIRFLTYAVCVSAFIWLGLGSLHFRKSIRTSLSEAYSLLQRVDPEHAGDNYKVLNSYYEDVYRKLPAIAVPACLLMLGSTVLLLLRRGSKAIELDHSRGYNDLDPEKCWEQWLEYKESLDS